MINPFFRNSGPFKISDILQLINLIIMNYEILKKKNAVTTMIFDESNMLDDYNRSVLKDLGPDPPTLASDIDRKNNYSKMKINLFIS